MWHLSTEKANEFCYTVVYLLHTMHSAIGPFCSPASNAVANAPKICLCWQLKLKVYCQIKIEEIGINFLMLLWTADLQNIAQ